MRQLRCYVPEEAAKKLQQKAEQTHLSASKYLARLIQRDLDNQWPEDYFDLYGSWEGQTLGRPDQGALEQREAML